MLRLILSSHSKIEIPPETWFLIPLVEQLPLLSPLSREQQRQAVSIITGHYRWPDMGIDAASLGGWVDSLHQPGLADIMALMYRFHAQNSGKQRIGDKTPPYIRIVPELAVLYPGAKFIHLVRDGRDVAMSYLDAKFSGAPYEPSFEWTTAVRLGRQYMQTELADRIMRVKYEDLVRSLEPTVRQVCRFLSEEFEPQMLNWQRSIPGRIPERERLIHTSLTQPVSKSAVSVWRSRLSLAELFVLEACIQEELQANDYPPYFSGRRWRPLVFAGRKVLPTLGPLLRRGVQALRHRGLLSRQVYV
ncbi:MAG: sulfotransferase [Pseudomonadota bacterium]|nr:sulfotransferase [Pseudomonadota bacterium]